MKKARLLFVVLLWLTTSCVTLAPDSTPAATATAASITAPSATPTPAPLPTATPILPVLEGTPIPYPNHIITSRLLDRWLVLLAQWPFESFSPPQNGVYYNVYSTSSISPDGKLLATMAIGKTIKLFNLSTRKNIWSVNDAPQFSFPIKFSPDGKSFIIGCSIRRTFDGTLIHQFVPDNRCWDLMFLPDGETALLRSIITWQGRIYLNFWKQEATGWPDVTIGKPFKKYALLSDDNAPIGPANLFISQDGTLLIADGYSLAPNPFYVWIFQVSDGKLIKKFSFQPQDNLNVTDVKSALSPDGSLIAIGVSRANTSGKWYSDHRYTVEIWRLADMVKVHELKGLSGAGRPVFSPDGTILAVGNSFWETSTGVLMSTKFSIPEDGDLVFSPDQKLIVVNAEDYKNNEYIIQVYGIRP